jgi:uncharacterized 2Fe-2S/4Fe-4S cluster protein (DUF4445 family)
MSGKVSVTVRPQGLTLEAERGESLLDALAKAGIVVTSDCGGLGNCGKCQVQISGNVPAPSSLDRLHLSANELAAGMRLACGVIPSGGEIVECPPSPSGTNYKLQLDEVSFHVTPWREEAGGGAVLAVDLGTTNIVGHLVDPVTGRVVTSSNRENSQAVFGADIMSRLTYASHNGEKGRETLRRAARSDIESLAEDIRFEQPVTDVVAVMNTAMEVLLLGTDPDLLGRYPCDSGIDGPVHIASPFTGGRLQGAVLHLPSIIGGFVGSDTVAALLSLKMFSPKPPYVLLDIGTNAEVVIVTDREMLACSTAAGPAFEGMGITCGMRGVAGAIDRVLFDKGDFSISVIDGGTARGVTGSGLFSLIGGLLRAGALDTFGVMQAPLFLPGRIRRGDGGNEVILAPGVTVSENDVQQFLLAKAAARSAVDTLLNSTNVMPGDLTAFYLAGTFAGMIEPSDLLSPGLVPPDCGDRVRQVGNAAATGAVMMAASESVFREACVLAGSVRHLSLSGDRAFLDAFQSGVHF